MRGGRAAVQVALRSSGTQSRAVRLRRVQMMRATLAVAALGAVTSVAPARAATINVTTGRKVKKHGKGRKAKRTVCVAPGRHRLTKKTRCTRDVASGTLKRKLKAGSRSVGVLGPDRPQARHLPGHDHRDRRVAEPLQAGDADLHDRPRLNGELSARADLVRCALSSWPTLR